MYSYLLVLYTATILLQGVSCRLFPQSILDRGAHVMDSKVYKRQGSGDSTDTTESPLTVEQCALDRFDAFFQGNNSQFVRDCRSVVNFDPSISNDQAAINTIFGSFCNPECGDVILDIYSACEVFDSRAEMIFNNNLCEINENGDLCYEIYIESIVLLSLTVSCFLDSDSCNCQAISERVRTQGCCVNSLRDFLSTLNNGLEQVDLEGVFSNCTVAASETMCTIPPPPQPMDSGSFPQGSYISATVIFFALFVIVTNITCAI